MFLIDFFFVLVMSEFREEEHDLCDIAMHISFLHQLQLENITFSVSLADVA